MQRVKSNNANFIVNYTEQIYYATVKIRIQVHAENSTSVDGHLLHKYKYTYINIPKIDMIFHVKNY